MLCLCFYSHKPSRDTPRVGTYSIDQTRAVQEEVLALKSHEYLQYNQCKFIFPVSLNYKDILLLIAWNVECQCCGKNFGPKGNLNIAVNLLIFLHSYKIS